MIGDCQEEAGFDPTRPTLGVSATDGRPRGAHVSRCWPASTWCAPGAALRVMTQDGFPIYDQSETVPAPSCRLPFRRHARRQSCADRCADDRGRAALDPTLVSFSARRFHVRAGCLSRQTAAVTLTVDGRRIAARAGDTVAAAMLAAGIEHLPHHAGLAARRARPIA